MAKLIYPDSGSFSSAARWITLPGLDRTEKNVFGRFRRTFRLDKVSASPLFRISAENYYTLACNSIAIGRGPVRGTCRLAFFDTWDLSGALHEGENTIEVEIHAPMYENFVQDPSEPATIFELEGVFASDDTVEAGRLTQYLPDECYWTYQSGYKLHVDLRIEPEALRAAEFAHSEKLAAKTLLPRDVPPLRETRVRPLDVARTARFRPGELASGETVSLLLNREEWEPPSPGDFCGQNTLLADAKEGAFVLRAVPGKGAAAVFDFGQDYIGYPELEIEAPSGTVVDLVYGEDLWQGKVRAHYSSNYHFTDRFILKDGVNRIGSTLCERSMRYLSVVVRDFAADVTIRRVTMLDHRYDYACRASFYSSDPLLNRIWKICVATLETCTTDIFNDCPWRERAFWVNDLIVENRTTLAAFGDCDVHRRAFRLLFSQQRPDGWVPGVCPAPRADGRESFVLPPTNLFLFQMLHDYWMVSGDLQTAATYLPHLEKIIAAIESSADADGIVAPPEDFWNFYDWGFEQTGHKFEKVRESMFNTLYVIALEKYLALCRAAGRSCDFDFYQKRIEALGKAVLARFLNERTGLLEDPVRRFAWDKECGVDQEYDAKVSTQLAHALAILSGVTREEHLRDFAAALDRADTLKPEYYLTYYVFRAMKRCGMAENALARIRFFWGRCVETGSELMYESGVARFGKAAFSEAGSLCHGFATAPIDFVQHTILGIEPLEPGFAKFSLTPNLLDLNFAEGRVPTAYGNISVRLEKRKADGAVTCVIRIPDGCAAVRADGGVLGAGTHEFTF
ncbi:MAG: family 78 glycoside hydrolase catalytic domain [Victivallaceae bacterium]|nr:family 78 glycoside hydrolase catalytic domain [Victivallaceae bacterium]